MYGEVVAPWAIGLGDGIFVAPGLVLTCAHVVREVVRVAVVWRGREVGVAVVVRSLPDPHDVALLRVEVPVGESPPAVCLDGEVRSRDPLYLFGYPDQDFPNGCPVTVDCEGLTGDEPALIKFALGQVRPGMSGSPLLNQRTGRVCGMVKFTRDRSSDLGGGAVAGEVILERFPELRSAPAEIDDVKSYLQTAAAHYQKWQQCYTPTDAQGKQRQPSKTQGLFQDSSLLLDLGLMVQTVKRELDPRQEREAQEKRVPEKIEQFSVLDGLRTYVDRYQQVLLVGQPGSGKSTALARLMLEEATSQTSEVSASPRIPVLVELRYWQSSIEQLILNAFKRHNLSVPTEQLEPVLATVLLLFDGVNELPSETARTQLSAFRRNHPQVAMIFTTRDLSLGGDVGIEHKLEMQPLTEPQMQAFIRAYIPTQAEAMLGQLQGRLREFGKTPLLLWMLCSVFQQTQAIPQNLGEVFRAFTRSYEQRLKQDMVVESDRAWWQPVLQQLAWVMMQGAQPTELRAAIAKKEAVGAISQFLNGKVPYAEDFARKCLRDLQKHHLIQSGTNPEELEFRHQLIQEYYAAEALLEQLPDLSDGELQREYLNYLKWTEPVALMLALVESEMQAVQVVERALAVDLMLGARLAGEVKPKFQAQTMNLVDALEVPDWLKIKPSGKTGSEFDVRKQTVDEVGKIDSKTAIPDLLKLLKDADSDIRGKAAETLGKIGSEAAIPGLLNLLEDWSGAIWPDPYSDVRWIAAEALGKIGSERAISSLLKFLEDDDYRLRKSAAEALGKIGSATAILGLLKFLEDDSSAVRGSTAATLDKIRETSLLGLLKFFEYDASDVRSSTTSALDKIGSETVFSSLLKLLENDNFYVCRSAAEVLGKIGSEEAIPGLINLLEYDNHKCWRSDYYYDVDLSWSAAEALGEIAKKHPNGKITSYILDLLILLPSDAGKNAHRAILIIQFKWGFYNYEIHQKVQACTPDDRLSPQDKLDRIESQLDTLINERTKQMPDQPQYAAKYAITGNPTIVEGNMEVKGDNVGTKNVYNSFGADDDLLQQITDLQQFITELETQHPHVQTLPEAETARDQAINQIQAANPPRWKTIRDQMRLLKRQLLNPERHGQAAKASLVEVAKRWCENSLIATAIITYIDKLSETPDQGA